MGIRTLLRRRRLLLAGFLLPSLIPSLTILHGQIYCTACANGCPMTVSWAHYPDGCGCVDYYECVPVFTCDECLYDGLEYCYDDYGGCEYVAQITFNTATGCCFEEDGEYT